jgi:hypothetical protein
MTQRGRFFLSLARIALAGTLAGCAGREPPRISRNAAQPQTDHEYVDLQPGWRIKVVTPILRSGKFIVDEQAVEQKGSETIIKAGADFVGYEISRYSVRPHPGGGVFIRFSSAEAVRDGKPAKESRPLVPLFDLPADTPFLRLFFLTRVSKADHDQGILAASSLQQLNKATQNLEADPEKNCVREGETFCFWIPRGIAVQPEKRDPANRKDWLPAW